MAARPKWSLFRWASNVLRDPALYVILFTFYAGMNPRLSLEQLALSYAGTVLVMIVWEVWCSRLASNGELLNDVGRGALWGSILFLIGFAWGSSCGYILMWMQR